MNLQKASGVLSNLQVVHTKQSILYGPQMKEASGVSALAFALTGMSGAAVQTSMNSDGGTDDVDIYSFDIEGVRYSGCTRGISLKNGDEVELVYKARTEGREAIAVRRPSTRSIWLYPYMSRGSMASVFAGTFLWIKSAGVAGVILALIANGANFMMDKSWITASEFFMIFILTFVFLGLGVSWMLPRLLHFSRTADEVFATFDYLNPKMVDLHKTSKAYRKAHDITWSSKNNFELWY